MKVAFLSLFAAPQPHEPVGKGLLIQALTDAEYEEMLETPLPKIFTTYTHSF